jgi:hypothetical protein
MGIPAGVFMGPGQKPRASELRAGALVGARNTSPPLQRDLLRCGPRSRNHELRNYGQERWWGPATPLHRSNAIYFGAVLTIKIPHLR